MSFERIRATRLGGFLAAGAAAVALAGCGGNEQVLPIEVPQNAVDLGGSLNGEHGRSFVVFNIDVSRVYCGGVIDRMDPLIGGRDPAEDQREDFGKRVRPAGAGKSEIDCVYDDWFADYSEIEENMVINHFQSLSNASE